MTRKPDLSARRRLLQPIAERQFRILPAYHARENPKNPASSTTKKALRRSARRLPILPRGQQSHFLKFSFCFYSSPLFSKLKSPARRNASKPLAAAADLFPG